jgi:DNA-3-methyladenine glycosylase I
MADRSLVRCTWVGDRPDGDAMLCYHDEEWGLPQHDDRRLFELLTLEGAQAGLSWQTVLNRRQGYRRAFLDFDFVRVAAFTDADAARLLADPGIVRNRAKIASTIDNARAVLAVREEIGSFDAYLWGFVGGRPLVNRFERLEQLPAKTAESAAMSKDLLRRGFRFCGPTICYALMQAAGLVNDHLVSCFRYQEVQAA